MIFICNTITSKILEKLVFSNDIEVIFSFSDCHKLVLPVLNYNS